MGLYEMSCDESLPGLGIGMTNEVFQLEGRRQDLRELLLFALFNHPRLLIQVARVQKAQFSYRLDGLVP